MCVCVLFHEINKLRNEDGNLIPWPGPQCTNETEMLVVPGPMETQSSPTPMVEEVMLMLVERLMWIPSVLGLSPGASMFTSLTFMLSHRWIPKWNPLLFNKLMLLTVPCETPMNLRLCMNCLTVTTKTEKKKVVE